MKNCIHILWQILNTGIPLACTTSQSTKLYHRLDEAEKQKNFIFVSWIMKKSGKPNLSPYICIWYQFTCCVEIDIPVFTSTTNLPISWVNIWPALYFWQFQLSKLYKRLVTHLFKIQIGSDSGILMLILLIIFVWCQLQRKFVASGW